MEMEEFREAVRKDVKQEILDEINKEIKHWGETYDVNEDERDKHGKLGIINGLCKAKQIINKHL